MKTNTLLLLSLLFLTSAYGQKIDVQVGGNYYFKGNHQIIKDQKGNLKSIYTNYNVYKNTNVLNNTQTIDKLQLEREAVTDEIIKENHVVTIVAISDGQVYYSYIPFKNKRKQAQVDKLNSIYVYNKIFSLPIEVFSSITAKRFNRFRDLKVKPFTVPIRLRGAKDNFEFETNLSIGTSITGGISYDVKRQNRFIEGSVGLGISRVNLNEDNSNLGSTIASEQGLVEQTAFTFSIGTVFYYEGINAGIFLGWDYLSGKTQKQFNWVHNQKPWLGVGINIGIGQAKNNNSSNLIKNKPNKD